MVNVEVEVEILHIVHQRTLVPGVWCHDPVQVRQPSQLKYGHAAGMTDVGLQGRKGVQRAAADQVPEEEGLIDAVADDRGGLEPVLVVTLP